MQIDAPFFWHLQEVLLQDLAISDDNKQIGLIGSKEGSKFGRGYNLRLIDGEIRIEGKSGLFNGGGDWTPRPSHRTIRF